MKTRTAILALPLLLASAASADVKYGFDGNTNGWRIDGPAVKSISATKANVQAGKGALAVQFSGKPGRSIVYVFNPGASAGKTVTFYVWVPTGNTLTSVQAYVQQGPDAKWAWTGTWKNAGDFQPNAWTAVKVAVPAKAKKLNGLGIEFISKTGWKGTAYIDSVGW